MFRRFSKTFLMVAYSLVLAAGGLASESKANETRAGSVCANFGVEAPQERVEGTGADLGYRFNLSYFEPVGAVAANRELVADLLVFGPSGMLEHEVSKGETQFLLSRLIDFRKRARLEWRLLKEDPPTGEEIEREGSLHLSLEEVDRLLIVMGQTEVFSLPSRVDVEEPRSRFNGAPVYRQGFLERSFLGKSDYHYRFMPGGGITLCPIDQVGIALSELLVMHGVEFEWKEFSWGL